MISSILIGLLIYLLFQWNSKVEFYHLKKEGNPFKAEVVEYRYHKSPMRNDYTQMSYPYVKINEESERLIKLKYARSGSKPFKIGEQVDVFWYAGVLYFWHAYDRGINKFLPKKRDFWNKD